jgi:hypothetical protein
MSDSPDRREFLKSTLGAGLGAAVLASGTEAAAQAPGRAPEALFAAPAVDRVRLGLIGIGNQGSSHLRNFLKIPGLEVKAICDLVPAKVEKALAAIAKAGAPAPATFTGGPEAWKKLCDLDLDVVYVVTPWDLHAPMCLEAMRKGKHAATEVPLAPTLDECWQLVEAAEKTSRHCVMMENCNYDRFELMALRLVRQGMLGEVLHGEAAYLHDLREIKFSTEGEGLWRRAWSTTRNGNLYPTHGLGPVANCMDINRGDRFLRVTSMSSPARGLQLWQEEHLSPDDPRRRERYVLGDQNVSLIQTARGRTIYLAHNTNSPRPYSRLQLLQGTKGIVSGWPYRVHVEGRSPGHRWEEAEAYYPEFDHPLWRSERIQRMDRGHGGMDFLEDYRLIGCLRRGEPTDMNVYDAAALSAMVELSIRSVARQGKPEEVPDFTRGRWKSWQPWPLVGE